MIRVRRGKARCLAFGLCSHYCHFFPLQVVAAADLLLKRHNDDSDVCMHSEVHENIHKFQSSQSIGFRSAFEILDLGHMFAV